MNVWSSGKGFDMNYQISLRTVGNIFARNEVKNWLK